MNKTQEQKWQAENDARTMANYQEILNDKGRLGRAIKVAKQQATDLNKRANAMQSVATFRNGGRMNFSSAVRGGSKGRVSNSKASSRTSSSRGRKK